MRHLLWSFAKNNTPIKIVFLLCTILLDFATILTYTAWGISISPIVFCILLLVNIVSTVGTIFSLCFSVVPDVCGYEYQVAARMLKQEGLNCSIICNDVIVMEQKPQAGEIVRKGSKIKLVVGKKSPDGTLKMVNVAFDEIPEHTLAGMRSALAMAGQPCSTNKRMTITEKDGTENKVEVITSFEFVDSRRNFIIYCEGLYDDNTPILCISQLSDGQLVEIQDEDWLRIRVLMRYLAFDKDPLRAKRTGKDGIEILC